MPRSCSVVKKELNSLVKLLQLFSSLWPYRPWQGWPGDGPAKRTSRRLHWVWLLRQRFACARHAAI